MSYLVLQGDARHIPLADQSVHMICTSPPFFGLRDYNTGQWEGGSVSCEHRSPQLRYAAAHGTCGTCGAVRIDKQIGLEQNVAAYIENLLTVFRECWRVLRDDGCVFVEIGDSYNSVDKWGGGKNGNTGKHVVAADGQVPSWAVRNKRLPTPGLKPKDKCLIPHRFAIAMQEDGWTVRQDIVWAKSNSMPESVTDRCATAHSYVFHFTKQARYFYDGDAIAEPIIKGAAGSTFTTGTTGVNGAGRVSQNERIERSTRTARSVWHLPTGQSDLPHYAMLNPEVIRRCVKAGSSQAGCCRTCRAPYVRVTERTAMEIRRSDRGQNIFGGHSTAASGTRRRPPTCRTLGFAPACSCPDPGPPVPCRVFDPFGGPASVARVAEHLGRHGISLDLSLAYCGLGRDRLRNDAPLFADLTAPRGAGHHIQAPLWETEEHEPR